MTEDGRGVMRAYSQDRHESILQSRKTSIKTQSLSKSYYSSRNCPELISLFALQNRQLDNREKRIYQSTSNDEHYFNMINYSIQSRTATPTPNLISQNILPEDKETRFPKVTPRGTPIIAKKFPTVTSKRTSIAHRKDSIAASVKSTASSICNSTSFPVTMPRISNEKKPNFQLSNMSRRPEWKYSYY